MPEYYLPLGLVITLHKDGRRTERLTLSMNKYPKNKICIMAHSLFDTIAVICVSEKGEPLNIL